MRCGLPSFYRSIIRCIPANNNTYLNTVHREKLLDDFSLNTSAELKAAVLSIEGDRRYREYKALDSMPFLKQLISRLMIEVFFLSGEPAF